VQPEIHADTGLVMATVSDPAMAAAVVRRLDDEGITAAELTLRLPSLDEVFLTLTGHRAEDDSAKDDAATTEGKAA
jgi:oleandomycin transport system ATP-binding protein